MPTLGVAALNTAAFEVDLGALGAVEGSAEAEALQAVVGKRQLLALDVEFALRRIQAAGHVEAAIDLPA